MRTFPRGTRELGEQCRLTIAVNGTERAHFDEDAGDLAPKELVVDIRSSADDMDMLLSAMETRPWACPDSPVIICPTKSNESGLCYLIRTSEISDMVQVIRDGLDMAPSGSLGWGQINATQTRLDAAAGQG